MSVQADEALALIDEVADAIEIIKHRKDKYEVGRQVIIDYAKTPSCQPYVFAQAAKYLFAVLDMHPQEQL